MAIFERKIYALLGDGDEWQQLDCLKTPDGEAAREWWERYGQDIEAIASSSDRVNLQLKSPQSSEIIVKHPLSGQSQNLPSTNFSAQSPLPEWIQREPDPRTVFTWLWRFQAEQEQQQNRDYLLYPQHQILPDCPIHSYRASVSALAGAVDFNAEAQVSQYPHLLLFTFSPIQDFIKASRKFLDFWSGSYLLHYLSARLCQYIADRLGPDAIITPSLWGQEIMDALLVQQDRRFKQSFQHLSPNRNDPIDRFKQRDSTALATAGFPNTLVVLVPGQALAEELGECLSQELRNQWQAIAHNVREGIPDHPLPELRRGIRDRTIAFLEDSNNQGKVDEIVQDEDPNSDSSVQNEHDINKWKTQSNWSWRKLWDAQIERTWQPYWTAVPLGDPNSPLSVNLNSDEDSAWIDQQERVAETRGTEPPPNSAEKALYQQLNNGTWWGSIQARCGKAIQAIKNTRLWELPVSPGMRSSLSGQLSALHPGFVYQGKFQEGYGMPPDTMRLFWRLMAKVYPGLFDGSEMLNALELTKRMAWVYGGVGESLGVQLDYSNSPPKSDGSDSSPELDYSQFIRFPNLSAIAAARFSYEDWRQSGGILSRYWRSLRTAIADEFGAGSEESRQFAARTRGRPNQIPKTDTCINPDGHAGQDYNGAMFSSKWLGDDLGLDRKDLLRLRPLVEQAHRHVGLEGGSPSDWWVLVAADGDGMGQYVSGKKLHPYRYYLSETDPERLIDRQDYPHLDEAAYQQTKRAFIEAFNREDDRTHPGLLNLRKRMGPATHIGLNRALLDFSNRLVPFITEKRFCGRVIYSGGDDVMAVLPLEDLVDYLLCLRAAWCGATDPDPNPTPPVHFTNEGGYWWPSSADEDLQGLPNRALFTMGEGATLSIGIVIAHKSVPLATALDAVWEAEGDRAKAMLGKPKQPLNPEQPLNSEQPEDIPAKNGLCFRVLYSSGNSLEALIKGELYPSWREWMTTDNPELLSGLLYRLAEEIPRHATWSKGNYLIAEAARVIALRRDETEAIAHNIEQLLDWLRRWQDWAEPFQELPNQDRPPGVEITDLAKLLQFSAFWLDKMEQRQGWHQNGEEQA